MVWMRWRGVVDETTVDGAWILGRNLWWRRITQLFLVVCCEGIPYEPVSWWHRTHNKDSQLIAMGIMEMPKISMHRRAGHAGKVRDWVVHRSCITA